MGEDLLARGLLVSPFPIRLQIPYCYALSQRSGVPAILSVKQFRQWLVSEIELHKRAMKLV
jgi:LysR family glycine cleavage system transcriptional activator